MRLRKMTSGEDAKVVEYQNDLAGRWRRKRRMSLMGGRWWRRRGVVVLVGVVGGGGATSPRGALKKTKAAPRRRVQCADSPGRVYARPTNKRDLLSTCMETFWGFYSFFLKLCFCWGITGEYSTLSASSVQFSAGRGGGGELRRLESRVHIIRLETRVKGVDDESEIDREK